MQFHHASCLLCVLSAQVAVAPTHAQHFDGLERVLRAASDLGRKKCIKDITRIQGKLIVTWLKECTYNNVCAWVKSALKEAQLHVRGEVWPCGAPRRAACGSADNPGAPPAAAPRRRGPPLLGAAPKRKASARWLGQRGKLPRWSSGVLRPRPAQLQAEGAAASDAAEGAGPAASGDASSPAPPKHPRWFLHKILAKSDGLHKKPRGLGMQSVPDLFANATLLGEGAFAHTYRYAHHELGDVALKVLKRRDEVEDVLAEVDFMTNFDHPNIVKCLDVVVCKKWAIIMPYGGETLHYWVHRPEWGVIPWPQRLSLTSQLVAAVAYMHGLHVLHTDLKPCNIVLDASEDHLVVIDLGSCVVDLPDHRQLWLPRFDQPEIPCGTLFFRAPETLLGWKDIRAGVDIWATGCTIWEIWVGSTLFKAWTRPAMVKKIFSQTGLPVGDALSFYLTLPNWRRELKAYGTGKESLSWKRRMSHVGPSKAHGFWLDQLLRLVPSQRPSADDLEAGLARLPGA